MPTLSTCSVLFAARPLEMTLAPFQLILLCETSSDVRVLQDFRHLDTATDPSYSRPFQERSSEVNVGFIYNVQRRHLYRYFNFVLSLHVTKKIDIVSIAWRHTFKIVY